VFQPPSPPQPCGGGGGEKEEEEEEESRGEQPGTHDVDVKPWYMSLLIPYPLIDHFSKSTLHYYWYYYKR